MDNSYQDYFKSVNGQANVDSPSNPQYNPYSNAQSNYTPRQTIAMADKLGKITHAIMNPSSTIMEAAGVPQHFNLPDYIKYSPESNFTAKMAGLDLSKTNDRDLMGSSMDTAISMGAGAVSKAAYIEDNMNKLKKLKTYLNNIVKTEYIKAGSYEGILKSDTLTDKLLQAREMAGEIDHPEILKEANEVIHKIVPSKLTVGTSKEYLAQMKNEKLIETLKRLPEKAKSWSSGLGEEKIAKMQSMLKETIGGNPGWKPTIKEYELNPKYFQKAEVDDEIITKLADLVPDKNKFLGNLRQSGEYIW